MTSDGNIDYIYDLFDRVESMHWSCKNCSKNFLNEWLNGGFFCSGVVKRPSKAKPFDTVRVCTSKKGVFKDDITDYSPDEAMTMIEIMSYSVNEWLKGTKEYIKFRDV